MKKLSKEEFKNKLKSDIIFRKKYGNKHINQIDNVINTLKNNPDSRRILLSAWNPNDIPEQALDCCHYGFQVITREMNFKERTDAFEEYRKRNSLDASGLTTEGALEHFNFPKRKISLKWNQRSVDTFLGLPFNIASYGFLLHMIAQQVNMIPEELIGSLGDTHIYSNHVDQVQEQLSRDSFEIPRLKLRKAKDIYSYEFSDFEITNYNSHPAIKAPISV